MKEREGNAESGLRNSDFSRAGGGRIPHSAFRIPLFVLGVMFFTYSLGPLSANAESKLQWRRGRTPRSEKVIHKARKSRPSTVRLAAYNDNEESGGYAGQAEIQSIVVHREDRVRLSQLPWNDQDQEDRQDQDQDQDLFFEEELRAPFGEESQDELPEQDQAALEDSLPAPPVLQEPAEEPRPTLPENQDYQTVEEGPQDEGPDTFQQQNQQPTLDPFEQREEPLQLDLDSSTDYQAYEDTLEDLHAKALGRCTEELSELRASTLHDVDLHITVEGTPGEDVPFECSIDDGTWLADRSWPETVYMWKASALCHKPLYFEDEHLERYGHSWGPYVQPFVSGAHFFTRLPVLPYCMGLKTPNECVYTLGHYRPGSCAPYMIDPVPITLRAALFEAGAVVGAAAVVP